jgi:hypothetical protein
MASAVPPAASISLATLWIVPESLWCGSDVLPVTTMFARSRAQRSAISRPMPRVAPVMKTVFPLSPDIRKPQISRQGAKNAKEIRSNNNKIRKPKQFESEMPTIRMTVH